MTRKPLLAALLAASSIASARGVAAQGSTYVPLDDVAYSYVDALVARGMLRTLPSLERPYTARRIREALASSDTLGEGRAVRAWVRALDAAVSRWEPRDPSDAPALRVATYGIGTAETSSRRELMLANDVGGAYPGVGGRAVLTAGTLTATVRMRLDKRLAADPDFGGDQRRGVSARTEDAYVVAQWKWASAFFGRQSRNWGPPRLEGLQLGGYADSWDHLSARLGSDRIAVTSIVARLDPYVAGGDSGTYQRQLAMHRLAGRWRDLELAASEAVVYGGVGRGMEFAYANPLTLYQLSQYNETRDGNVSYAAEASWRAGRRGVYAAQVLIDDFQIDRCSPGCEEPTSWGGTLSAEGVPLWGAHRLFASYTRVANLTYRTLQPWERWTSFDVGIGRPFADYDEARFGIDAATFATAPVRVYAAHRRQGEGDYRAAFPAPAQLPTTPGFLAGVVERAWRVGVASGASLGGRASVDLDVGFNVARDAGHVAGETRRGVEARVRASVDFARTTVRP